MLKTRIIGVLIVKEGIVVQSVGFKKYLPVGSPAIAVEYLNRWGIDEIILLDIDARLEGRDPQFSEIRHIAQYCHTPLTIGGGIDSVDHIKKLLHSGADRVAINSSMFSDFSLITDGSRVFGGQCIVASIDVKKSDSQDYHVFSHSGTLNTGYTAVEAALDAERHGAGEIFINSIDLDGSKRGYDLCLIKKITEAVDIPVIICGGASHPIHFQEALDSGVSGAAAANFFHYSEQSVLNLKSYLKSRGLNVRSQIYGDYEGCEFDTLGRINKLNAPAR